MQVRVKGLQVEFTDAGQGTSLLLVHGFPLNRGAWNRQVAAFQPRFRVIAPDLRGMGGSQATAGPVAMERYAEDLHALLGCLEAEPAIVVGHSMGGYVALALARAFPQVLRGLVLVATKAGADAPAVAAARRATAAKVRTEGTAAVVQDMAARMLAGNPPDAAMAAEVQGFMSPAQSEGIIAALLGMAERPDAGTWLAQITVPTLVVAGTEDSIIPPSESQALAKAIPRAQLRLIEHAGHLVAFEQAGAFNAVLETWLADSGLA